MKKKDLEATLKEKVTPLLEDSIERNLGITLPQLGSDITDRLVNSHLNIYIHARLPFEKAKKLFKKEFLKRELEFHVGNVSRLAKILGIDRRSIHRTIKELDIELPRRASNPEKYKEIFIDQTIRTTLEQYKEILHPQKIEKIYQDVPKLSRNLAQLLPSLDLSWKEAGEEFERQFLQKALRENQWNIAKAAEKVQIRPETLHRKIRKLGLRKE